MATEIPLSLQTAYAELLDRVAAADFDEAFPEDGAFISKAIRGRRYWYFQTSAASGRKQRYVGPETPEILDRIVNHKHARHSLRDRHSLVSTLIRSAYLPRPVSSIGDIVAALAAAGVFRLRGVLVGTVAYQTYAAMLGVRLAAAHVQTDDIDLAQYKNISIAVGDKTPPILDVLQSIDPTFRAIPNQHDGRRATTYQAKKSGLRVDFLTPNAGPDSDAPQTLPALGTDAQPLRFLDFLIAAPEPAALLHEAGIFVRVPSPDRFAVHKLIVAQRRRPGTGKQDKDLRQAEALLDVLSQKRASDLKNAWDEAYKRGPKWRKLLGEGLAAINADIRDRTLKTVGVTRTIIPGLKLTFAAPASRYDFDRDVVTFIGQAGGTVVRCAVSREALDDHFGTDRLGKDGRLEQFRKNRTTFEHMAQRKYLTWPVEDAGTVLIKTGDVKVLRKAV